MISVVDKYFSLNRTLLLIIGLWPYQRSIFYRLLPICYFGTVVSLIIFQFATFLTTKCTTDHIIKVLSSSFTLICLVIKFTSFYVNSDAVNYVMVQLQRIYNDIKDNNEIAIINKYGGIAKRKTTALTMCLGWIVFIVVGAQLMPHFINLNSSANESRPRHLLIPVEYFIDQEKYYYLLLFHLNATMCIALFATLATGAILIAIFQHVCGMFKITSYRIKSTIDTYIQCLNLKNEKFVYNNLIHGISIHREAIMCSEHLVSTLQITFMLLTTLGVIALSLNIFRALSSEYIIEDLALSFSSALAIIIYTFITNWTGQEIIDHYNFIFVAAYETQWYITPLYIQKLILFLLLRGNKSYGLNLGGLLIASIENFATIVNASLSYVIVLNSTM